MTDNLLKTKRFLPLLITQFLGALNDNLFKNALLTLVAIKMASQSDVLSNVIAGLFILPFFLFSAWAGEFADKYARDKIARILKIVEIILMCGVTVAYFFGSLPILVIIMTLMGTQSAFFGPIKYALLPQLLKTEELITANAYVEATTYMAILFGLILGTLLPIECTLILLIILAICGYLASRTIPDAPAPRPEMSVNKNLFKALKDNYRFLKKHRYIFQSILGASWFWIIGALAAVQIYPLCGKILNTDEWTITFFLILFSVGVAVGSYACNRLLKGYINTTYVPLSAICMALCLFGLWWLTDDYPTPSNKISLFEFLTTSNAWGISFCLFALAFWGGLYIIPLNAFMQNRAPKAYTASVIAGNNICNALGMAGISVFAIIVFKLGFTLPQLFFITGLISLVVAIYICSLLPDTLTRSLLQSVLKFMFRTKISGLQNFKKAGSKVLIIANHTSLWDGVLLAAFMPERITFAITSAWTSKWFMPIIRVLVDFYPVDTANPLSVRSLIEEIKKGRKVMMFPEGRISLTGKIMQVYDGAALVAARAGAKLLPVRIRGAQYSKLSYVKDKFRTSFFPKIDLHILPATRFELPLSKTARGSTARKLYELLANMMYETSEIPSTLFEALSEAAKIHGKNHIIARNILGQTLSYKQLIRQAMGYAKTLQPILEGKNRIGLAIPSGLSFLIAFWAVQCLGKTAVLLNPEQISEQVDVVLAWENLNSCNKPIILMSDLKPALWGKITPATGNPAVGVFKASQILTYSAAELLQNFRRLDIVLPFNSKDLALSCLQSYDADGLVLGMILPILSGVKTCFYAGTHLKAVPHLIYDLAATVLFANREVYNFCQDEANAFDLFNLRMAFAIGDKISEETLDMWLKNFGVRILENYTPENSILIKAINTPTCYKFNSLGCPLPAITPDIATDDSGFVWSK